MGWDFYTFDSQPSFFIDEILIFLKQENEKTKSYEQDVPEVVKPGKGYSRT